MSRNKKPSWVAKQIHLCRKFSFTLQKEKKQFAKKIAKLEQKKLGVPSATSSVQFKPTNKSSMERVPVSFKPKQP